ncbi:SDR family NAD(P)-dependent oxidoreductase [Clostridium sp. Cult3]|uniref:SDR family NAD(P)-dependent oxidoreductase n=1 Tax=Clostridium sp. Cult3 TaxID=2079004 RepID=UPI001F453F61|nr:SDR family oxidoreductase [Clostridium sp. Cult3]MCF6460575.1 short-chain dehydrogenase [Clostridium sp. Cult3]
MGEMKGKVVIITGGSGGVGIATAKKFLENDAIVYLSDISEKNLKAATEELSKMGTVKYVVTDVSKVSDIENLIDTVAKDAGRIDVVVNSAGVWVEGNTDEMTEEMWDRTVDVNLKGTFFMCSRAIPELEKTKGCIVNVSSDAGVGGNPGDAIYNASKGGVTLLTKSLGLELAPRQIRVNAVAPADIETPMLAGQARDYGGGDEDGYYKDLLKKYPAGKHARFIKPEEVAECVYFLASPKVEPITSHTLSIDWGLTAGY